MLHTIWSTFRSVKDGQGEGRYVRTGECHKITCTTNFWMQKSCLIQFCANNVANVVNNAVVVLATAVLLPVFGLILKMVPRISYRS